LRRYGLYIFDLDGTLYRGSEVVAGAPEVVRSLRASGALIRFLTNNSGMTRAFFVDKLCRMGYEATPDEVFSTATGAAQYAVDQGYRSVFAVGEPGLSVTFREQGIAVVNAGDDGLVYPTEEPCDAVVVGICRTFTYDLMKSAMRAIRAGAPFIATNTDKTYPLEGGQLEPGAGSIVASIVACSGKEPDEIIGKPNPLLVQQIAALAGVPLSEVLAVGDRYETDIVCGLNAGCDGHLVMTGVTQTAPEGVSWSEDLSALLV
jgi:4-nitrophenyl phosphatase